VELVGPRPETLRETPWAHPARPYYAMGPHDDASRILAKLDAAVGAGNYDFIGGADVGEMIGLDEEFEDEGDEGEGDEGGE